MSDITNLSSREYNARNSLLCKCVNSASSSTRPSYCLLSDLRLQQMQERDFTETSQELRSGNDVIAFVIPLLHDALA